MEPPYRRGVRWAGIFYPRKRPTTSGRSRERSPLLPSVNWVRRGLKSLGRGKVGLDGELFPATPALSAAPTFMVMRRAPGTRSAPTPPRGPPRPLILHPGARRAAPTRPPPPTSPRLGTTAAAAPRPTPSQGRGALSRPPPPARERPRPSRRAPRPSAPRPPRPAPRPAGATVAGGPPRRPRAPPEGKVGAGGARGAPGAAGGRGRAPAERRMHGPFSSAALR